LNFVAARKQNTPGKRHRSPVWLRALIPVFLVVFFLGGIFSGYALYVTLRDVVAHVELPSLPVLRLPSIRLPKALASGSTGVSAPQMGTPDAQSGSENLPVAPPAAASVQEGSRINILLLGLNRPKNAAAWGYLKTSLARDPALAALWLYSPGRAYLLDNYQPPDNGEDAGAPAPPACARSIADASRAVRGREKR